MLRCLSAMTHQSFQTKPARAMKNTEQLYMQKTAVISQSPAEVKSAETVIFSAESLLPKATIQSLPIILTL